MPITIPNVFTANTLIVSDEVNENFAQLGQTALNRAGDTLIGNLAVSPGITIDGVDISEVLGLPGELHIHLVDTTGPVNVGENLTVEGTSLLKGATTLQSTLSVAGVSTFLSIPVAPSYLEAGRAVPMGYWQSEPFNAAHFTATANTQVPVGLWTLTAADVLVLRYAILGKTMLVAWNIVNSSVTATPNLLRIKIPGGRVAAGLATGTGSNQYVDNAVNGTGIALVIPSSDQILLQQLPADGTWAISVDKTNSRGSIAFEIA